MILSPYPLNYIFLPRESEKLFKTCVGSSDKWSFLFLLRLFLSPFLVHLDTFDTEWKGGTKDRTRPLQTLYLFVERDVCAQKSLGLLNS